ncbi:unnamed protein product [Chrysoparadoxa australica]
MRLLVLLALVVFEVTAWRQKKEKAVPTAPAWGDGDVLYISPASSASAHSLGEDCGSRDTPCPSLKDAFLSETGKSSSSLVLVLLPGEHTGPNNQGVMPAKAPASVVGLSTFEGQEAALDNPSIIACSSNAGRGVVMTPSGIVQLHGVGIQGCGGGGVLVKDLPHALIDSVSVKGCGLVLGGDEGGGGLFLQNSTLMLMDSEVSGNIVPGYGGGLLSEGNSTVTVEGTQIIENEAARGGGIAVVEGKLLLQGKNVLKDNAADAGGGGIWSSAATVSAEGTEFINNTARGTGKMCGELESCAGLGGAALFLAGSTVLTDTQFVGNSAQAQRERDDYARGGAVYQRWGELTVKGGAFTGNWAAAMVEAAAGGGGAVFLESVKASIASLELGENRVEALTHFSQFSSYGGAVLARGPQSSVLLDDVTLRDNRVVKGGSGGALWVEDGASVTVKGSRFLRNQVSSSYTHRAVGGAIAASATAELTVEGSTFEGNAALPDTGGDAAGGDAGGEQVDDNKTMHAPDGQSGEGGALAVAGARVHASKCSFVGNRCASGRFDTGCIGGGVSITGEASEVVFASCSFKENLALGDAGYGTYSSSGLGGAVAVKFASPEFTSCTFIGNAAQGGGDSSGEPSAGGAAFLFYAAPAPAAPPTFKDCTFTENSAGGSTEAAAAADVEGSGSSGDESRGLGGAIAAFGSRPLLRSCSFERNRAIAQRPGEKRSSLVTADLSPSYGGALLFTDDCNGALVEGCSFDGNAAVGGMGGDVALVSGVHHHGLGKMKKQKRVKKVGATGPAAWKVQPSDEGDSGFTARFSSCSFNPLQPDSANANASASWSTDSETSGAPFFFMADGGVAELLAPKFLAYGQLFTSLPQSHLHITGTDESPWSEQAELSLINVGALVSLSSSSAAAAAGDRTNPSESMAVRDLVLDDGVLELETSLSVLGQARMRGGTLRATAGAPVDVSVLGHIYLGTSGDGREPPYFPGTSLMHRLASGARGRGKGKGGLAAVRGHELSLAGVRVIVKDTADLSSTVRLDEDSVLQVAANGKLRVAGDDDCALIGQGSEESSPPALVIEGQVTVEEGRRLVVKRGLALSKAGVLALTLPPPLYSDAGEHFRPVQVASGRAELHGALKVAHSNAAGPIQMYRRWGVIRVAAAHNDSALDMDTTELQVIGPEGISMEPHIQRFGGVSQRQERGKGLLDGFGDWHVLLEAAFIQCGQMLTYADVGRAGGSCQACLLNKACGWCGEGSGCSGASDAKARQLKGCSFDSCCPGDCHGHGSCNHMTGECSCSWYFSGVDCSSASVRGALAFSAVVSIAVLCGLAVASRQYSRQQQLKAVKGTLQELRLGLLGGSGEEDEEGGRELPQRRRLARHVSFQHMWPRDYLDELQQDLVLRDVLVDFEELNLDNRIGDGTAGVVYKGVWRGAPVAVKMIRRPFWEQLTEQDMEGFKREAYLMSRLRHPNIVLIMGVSFAAMPVEGEAGKKPEEDDSESARRTLQARQRLQDLGFPEEEGQGIKTLCIITEFLSQGSLDVVIASGGLKGAKYSLLLSIALQAARGMLYLHMHNPPVCHRDLKSSNLVIDGNWQVKVTDFGMSRLLPEYSVADAGERKAGLSGSRRGSGSGWQETKSGETCGSHMTSNLGTVAWAAPEMFSSSMVSSYSTSADIYSFGVVLWELWEKRLPFSHLTSRFDIMDAVRDGVRPEITSPPPQAYHRLMERCWHADASERPDFVEVVEILMAEVQQVQQGTSVESPTRTGVNPWTAGTSRAL